MKFQLFGAAILGVVQGCSECVESGQSYAVGGASMTCNDNSHWGFLDTRGQDCDAYTNGQDCGLYDHPEFRADALCCNCGGGTRTVNNDM